MTVYLCQDNYENIMCAVYDAWMSRKGHDHVRLELVGSENLELFCQYQDVETDKEKVEKVTTAICKKICQEAYQWIFEASLSQDIGKADKIYRFLIYGFHYGREVLKMLQIPAVYDIFQLCRNIRNEQHQLMQFVRFSQMEGGILVGRIGPKNDVLVLLAPHFADRLGGENWILYDEKRKKAVIHKADDIWMIIHADTAVWQEKLRQKTDEEEYQSLWKAFRESISIKERYNPVCQRNHMPLRYRPYMTEFQHE